MKLFAAIVCLLCVPAQVMAQFNSSDANATRSSSEQFMAHPSRGGIPSRFAPATQRVSMQPALLVISCERIKLALARKLGVNAPWQGIIHLHPRAARLPGEPGCIVVDRPLTRWTYHVDLPDSLDHEGFTLAIVQALLLEMANRNATTRSAEIPLWLTQGLTEELLAASSAELILPAQSYRMEMGLNLSRTLAEGVRENPVQRVQRTLRTLRPLTFEQLSWAEDVNQSPETAAAFRSSAQLFVNRLLILPDGRASLRATLSGLPHHFNWQFAFLNGFQSRFQTLLDVEKWWALQVVQFTGRDLMQTFTLQESCSKLDVALHARVEVRDRADELPRYRQTSLQEIIREWDALSQRPVLQRKLTELDVLRLQVAQDAVPLVDGYRRVLAIYLAVPPSGTSLFSFRRSPVQILNRAAEEAIQQLDALDAQRNQLRSDQPLPSAPLAAQ